MAQDPLEGTARGDSGEANTSPDPGMATVFSSSTFDAELEANNIHTLLESNGLNSVIVGSTIIPSLEFQVQVPAEQAEEARRLIEEAQAGGAEAADEAEAASETNP